MPPKKARNLGDAQTATIDSINQAQARLEAINADIKKAEEAKAFSQIEQESIQKNIDFLNQNLEQRQKDTKDFEENYKASLADLEIVKKAIEDKKVELVELERSSTSEIKKQIDSLNSDLKTLETKKSDLTDSITAFNLDITKANETLQTLKTSIDSLEQQKNDLLDLIKSETGHAQEVVDDTDKKKEQLSSYNSQLELIKKEIEDTKSEISGLELDKENIKKELVDLASKREEAQKQFDILSKKSQILIDRTEYQDGQEAWLKEQFDKIGREYQPYSQQ